MRVFFGQFDRRDVATGGGIRHGYAHEIAASDGEQKRKDKCLALARNETADTPSGIDRSRTDYRSQGDLLNEFRRCVVLKQQDFISISAHPQPMEFYLRRFMRSEQ